MAEQSDAFQYFSGGSTGASQGPFTTVADARQSLEAGGTGT